jgi:A118 family predicted phage portal protein
VDGSYRIENLLFDTDGDRLERLSLAEVPGFGEIPETVRTGRTERSFVLDRMNIVNNLETASPMGLSVFANALDQLRGVDVAYDSYVNEFTLGKKRIMVKPEATKDFDGAPLFDADELAFYILPEDSGNGSIIREIDMTLRTAEHHEGIQDMLNLLGLKCGLGEQHYRFERGSVLTATQVISENSALYRNVRRQELVLETALKELMALLLRMGNDYFGLGLKEDAAVSVDFDDSIIEDKSRDFERDCRMLELGVLGKEEFRKRWTA